MNTKKITEVSAWWVNRVMYGDHNVNVHFTTKSGKIHEAQVTVDQAAGLIADLRQAIARDRREAALGE